MMNNQSVHPALRAHGVCRGSLWRQHEKNTSSTNTLSAVSQLSQALLGSAGSSAGGGDTLAHPNNFLATTTTANTSTSMSASTSGSSSSSSNSKTLDFCLLVATRLTCFESYAAYQRGDMPVCVLHVVGASAWNRGAWGDHYAVDTLFRLVSHVGTHVTCQAPTKKCRDTWLAAFRTGLECALGQDNDDLDDVTEDNSAKIGSQGADSTSEATLALDLPLKPPSPTKSSKSSKSLMGSVVGVGAVVSKRKCCLSCGSIETSPSVSQQHQSPKVLLTTAASPVHHYGRELRVDLCTDCSVAQGLLDHAFWVQACLASAQYERRILQQAREKCWKLWEPSATVAVETTTTETPQMVGIEEEDSAPMADPSSSSLVVTAPVDDAASTSSNTQESWTQVSGSDGSPSPPEAASGGLTGSWHTIESTSSPINQQHQPILLQPPNQPWIHLPPTDETTKAITALVQDTAQFGVLARSSPLLEMLVQQMLQGQIGVPEFVEQLDEAARQRDGWSTALKRQAFRVAGDMGTAMKLLMEHALVNQYNNSAGTLHQSNYHHHIMSRSSGNHLETLSCVLEFLLDLCQEGEISSVAFFWPQLCHLHLRMLPPEDAAAVARVDLVEDFLLTVAVQHSIHLALELVWSHTADLEESLNPAPCSSACRRRRFAVLKFVCELESLLFDFDGGWGGGSVSLGKMLAATAHQVELMKQTMKQVQRLRKVAPVRLSRSVRLDKLTATKVDLSPEHAVQEKLRIAKNADYFSCHLNFTKRVCDIAEKLRFIELDKRAEALQEELELLNSSGTMGGDPLNKLRDGHLRVVRVPSTEGHVFRSKERTPVLLLVEMVDEVVDETQPAAQDQEASLDLQEEPEAGSSTSEFLDSALSTPARSDTPSDANVCAADTSGEVLAGASDGMQPSPIHGALKRFDTTGHLQSEAPTTPKRDVEKLVSSVVKQQLREIQLPDLRHGDSSERFISGDPMGTRTISSEAPSNVYHDLSRDVERKLIDRNEVIESKGSPDPRNKRMTSLMNSGALGGEQGESTNTLAPTGDIRREVLNALMMKGIKGNPIAAGTADSVQRSLQELERKRATELLLSDDEPKGEQNESAAIDSDKTRQRLVALGLTLGEDETRSKPSEEDEVMEAIRLLLVQNRVAQGVLSPADAAKFLQHASLHPVNSPRQQGGDSTDQKMLASSDFATVDAGDVDPRLVGCGPLPPAVLQALTLWKAEMVTNAELLELVKKDIEFVRHSVLMDAENLDKLNENSAFWGRFAFGERWAEKKSRIGSSSPFGSSPGWDLIGMIVKSNDDLRQEAFIMQLIELCQEAFEIAGLELWVSPYRILATGRTTGVIEMVRNAMSFDALKKRPGYGKGGLREHLLRMTEFTADPGDSFMTAQRNFVRSLAAYSLMSYFFLFKDRHNGNILLDTAGHVIHIDFGFVFGIAPGGSFSLEMSTPFKLTEEMLDVMGGMRSPLFSEFVTLFCCGFLALQAYHETFVTLVEITSKDSTFKCFDGRDADEVVSKVRERFCPQFNKEETISYALDLIKQATTSYGTRQYDIFQYLSQGIAT